MPSSFFKKLHALADTLMTRSDIELTRRMRALFYLFRLGLRIFKQWVRVNPLQKAAALTFQTALSLVPMLAIAFTLLRSVGDQGVQDNLLLFISRNVLPDMPDVTAQLKTFTDNISTNALGIVGLIFTLYTSWSLYDAVERMFNDIWRAASGRRLISRLLTFYALVTLLPGMAGASLYWTGRFVDAKWAQILVPLLIQFGALFLANKLLPNTTVRWSTALAGALFTSMALESLKHAFLIFAKRVLLNSYEGVYGNIGVIPLLLLWMYFSWALVLLGAVIASALQNVKLLDAEDRRQSGQEPINGLSAAQLLAIVSANHREGGDGITRVKLAETFGLTPQAVNQICERLKQQGLIAEVYGEKEGYIPGRDPAEITLEDVLGAFRSTDLEMAAGVTSPALRNLVMDLERSRQQRIAGVTIAQLRPTTGPAPTTIEPVTPAEIPDEPS